MDRMKPNQKANLSKNILGMKFMKRSVINIEKQQNQEDNQRFIDDEHWVLDIPELKEKKSEYDTEDSHIACQELRFGRVSFGNFNPEIEKLMASKNAAEKEKQSEEREKEVAVSDEEMADRYMKLIGTIAKKFKKTRTEKPKKTVKPDGVKKTKHKKAKSKEFMKPADD